MDIIPAWWGSEADFSLRDGYACGEDAVEGQTGW